MISPYEGATCPAFERPSAPVLLEGRRQELAARGLQDDQILRMVTVIPPTQLAPMLAVSEATLSRWRQDNAGPRYARTGQRTVVYPVIAVLDWLEERIVN